MECETKWRSSEGVEGVEGDKFEYKICFDFELLVEMRICPLSWLKV